MYYLTFLAVKIFFILLSCKCDNSNNVHEKQKNLFKVKRLFKNVVLVPELYLFCVIKNNFCEYLASFRETDIYLEFQFFRCKTLWTKSLNTLRRESRSFSEFSEKSLRKSKGVVTPFSLSLLPELVPGLINRPFYVRLFLISDPARADQKPLAGPYSRKREKKVGEKLRTFS